MTAPRSSTTRTRLVRLAAGVLAFGVAASPALTATAGEAATSSNPMYRTVSAPNVFFPLHASKVVKDQASYTSRHRGTDLNARCGTGVYSSQPGIAQVRQSEAWGNRYFIRVISNNGGLVTGYAYLTRALVTQGQIIQSGQLLGTLGPNPRTNKCSLFYTVNQSGRVQNPTTWLRYHVGEAPPVAQLFGGPGFNLASFNFLGASHTASGGRYPVAATRMAKAVAMIKARRLDVIGAQELQKVQRDAFLAQTGGQYQSFNFIGPKGREDTDNSIIWNTATMELVSTGMYDIPYFGGNTRHVPIVMLRQKSTGRTAYFLNVHNPADVEGPAARWRAQAIAIEKAKIIELRASGRPVFITGDFNDRQAAFCPMTAGKLTISPNSIPSMTCNYPAQSSIDWIFAAGQARFSYFLRDKSTQTNKISDHPIVITRAHLQD